MIYKELGRLLEYEIPCIEFYNEDGEIEYVANLHDFEFEDIDVVVSDYYEPFGIIKLARNGKEKPDLNGKGLQPPEGKL